MRALGNSSNFSDQLTKTFGALMACSNSLSKKSTHTGASINGVPIYIMGMNTIKINDNVYELTDEIPKVLFSPGYSGKSMKKDPDFLMFNNIKNDTVNTGIGNRTSKCKTFIGFA